MKIFTNKSSQRIYVRLRTSNPAKPYIRMSLGTKSREEAERIIRDTKLANIEAASQLGRLSREAISRITTGKKLSTKEAAEKWLASAHHRGEAPASTAKNRAVTNQWFTYLPHVRALPPIVLDEEHVAPFINRPGTAGASTRKRQLFALRGFLQYCADMGISMGNAANRVRVDLRALGHSQRESKPVEPFTLQEVETILANTEGWWHWATGIAASTGLRLGDIAQLEKASLERPGFLVVWTDKRDRRVCLPINDSVTPGLSNIIAKIPTSDSLFMFPEQRHQYDHITSGRPKFSVYFGRLLKAIGIEGKTFHSLRHHAITRWHAQGFSLESCMTYAGHTTTKSHLNYVH